jgi:hypothetical protein
VNDSLRVRRFQPSSRLDDTVQRLFDRQGAMLADQAVEVVPLDVFHRHELDASVLVGVEHRDDVGVAQPRSDVDFAAEPEQQVAAARQGRRQDLQRDDAAEPAMPGFEDDPHAPRAQLVEDEVVADDQPAGLTLAQGPRLVWGQLPGLHQRPGQPRHASEGPGHEPIELRSRISPSSWTARLNPSRSTGSAGRDGSASPADVPKIDSR